MFNNLYFSAGKVAQVVEHLPSKLKALSSNPSTEKKKKIYIYIHMHVLCFKKQYFCTFDYKCIK
jgi:hypothetical protein